MPWFQWRLGHVPSDPGREEWDGHDIDIDPGDDHDILKTSIKERSKSLPFGKQEK